MVVGPDFVCVWDSQGDVKRTDRTKVTKTLETTYSQVFGVPPPPPGRFVRAATHTWCEKIAHPKKKSMIP